ncbi:hypothetical protein LT85_2042 [Collimonas arenae]|uniref:Lipoprotein n=1 Tax=Collimonas arenae TaxID=279058 RepID=A0A0A1FBS1_9BURK|nr:hypothetical protein [Collimonas arenae]AIY41200.1 hypothetical protein LT85_2042 [Collimonas arenae]
MKRLPSPFSPYRLASLSLPLLLALGGCATSERIDGPDGRDAFLVECTDAEQSWRACYKKAAELCGRNGYFVYDQDRSPGRDARKKSMFIGCRDRQRPGWGNRD